MLPMLLEPSSTSCFSPSTIGHKLLPLFNQSEPLAPVIETFSRGVFAPSPQAAALPRPTCITVEMGFVVPPEVSLHAGPPFSFCSVHSGDGEQVVLLPGASPAVGTAEPLSFLISGVAHTALSCKDCFRPCGFPLPPFRPLQGL